MKTDVSRVMIIVFDGLRPDFVHSELMPSLYEYAKNKAFEFRESSTVFPSVTRVATTSLITGNYPRKHGIINNAFLQPNIFPNRVFDTSSFKMLEIAKKKYANGLITTKTLGEYLSESGKKFFSIHCGSPGASYLCNHKARELQHHAFSIHGPEASLTPQIYDIIKDNHSLNGLGKIPKINEVALSVDILLDTVFPIYNPDVSLVWFPEPDTSFHYKQIGSPGSKIALKNCDLQFSRILNWVEDQADKENILLLVLSDHGQITVKSELDITNLLASIGIKAVEDPSLSSDCYFTKGSVGELRFKNKDAGLIAAAKEALKEVSGFLTFCSNNFQHPNDELNFDDVCISHERMGELLYICDSDDDLNDFGYSGTGSFTGGLQIPGGYHGGLNKKEMKNLFLMSGPGILKSVSDKSAGIVDVTPTILNCLGLQPSSLMDGRFLGEAFGQLVGEETKKEISFEKGTLIKTQVAETEYIKYAQSKM